MWRHVKPIKLTKAREMRSAPTKSEASMWTALRGNKFHGLHFRRQHVILGYIVDFYCAKLKLVIEIDGGVHNTQIIVDGIRQTALEKAGLRVVRVGSFEVENDIGSVLKILRKNI
jgi:very-short-patch-repair endonuclease